MKKLFLEVSAIAGMMVCSVSMSSCTQDNDAVENSVTSGSQGLVSIEISSEISGGRTHLNGLNVEFDNTDKLAVWDGTTKREFTTSAGGSVALFKGEIAENASQLNILYPFSAGQDCTTGGTITATIPTEQTATAGTFDPKANLAAATATYTKGQNITCTLQNVCGVLKFTVPTGETYTKAVITGANGTEKIAGEVTIDATESTPKATGGSATEITLKGTIEGGKNYYVALIPQEYTDGIVVKLYEKDTYTYAYIDKTLTKSGGPVVIKPAVILNAGTIKAEWPDDAVDLGIRDATGRPTLWTTCNVGANTPSEFGGIFGWAATKPLYSSYTWSADKKSAALEWSNIHPEQKWAPNAIDMSQGYKRCNTPYYSNQYEGSQTKYTAADGKKILEEIDDAAYQYYTAQGKSGYRMPKNTDFQDLYNKCYWSWTDNYKSTGIGGYIVYKSVDVTKDYQRTKNSTHTYGTDTDPHIFLSRWHYYDYKPASINSTGEVDYWSSTVSNNTDSAYFLHGASGSVNPLENYFGRNAGLPIRAVYIPE